MRTIVIGDVHGCLEELNELLRLVEFKRNIDRLVFVGDLVDRGPDPVGVVRRVRGLQAECVMGNHEEKHVRWAQHEAKKKEAPTYQNPMWPFSEKRLAEHNALSDDDLHFLTSLPSYLRLDRQWVVVHAGFQPTKPLERQEKNVCYRVRYVDEAGNFVPGIHQREGSVRWATRWQGPEHVIYGHAVYDLTTPQIDEPVPGVFCLGIDTGCCFGGHLTACILQNGGGVGGLPAGRTIAQVRAKTEYSLYTSAED